MHLMQLTEEKMGDISQPHLTAIKVQEQDSS